MRGASSKPRVGGTFYSELNGEQQCSRMRGGFVTQSLPIPALQKLKFKKIYQAPGYFSNIVKASASSSPSDVGLPAPMNHRGE